MDLSILPPDALTALTWIVVALLSVCSFVGLVSVLLGPIKRLLGEPTLTDPLWKARAFTALKYADVVARNTPRAVDLLKMLQHELAIAAQRKVLEEQHKVIAKQERDLALQEGQIRTQAAVIRASQRPPAENDDGPTLATRKP